jgi:hypothetical protein
MKQDVKDNFLAMLLPEMRQHLMSKYIDSGTIIKGGKKLTIIYISDTQGLLTEYLQCNYNKPKDFVEFDLTQLTK